MRRRRGSAARWRWVATVSALGALLVVLASPARSASLSSVSKATVNNSSPSAAAGARTAYVVMFTTSSNGALSTAANGINLVFPSGTGLGSVSASSVDDLTTGDNGIGTCKPPSGERITCDVNPGVEIAGDDSVRVTIDGVTNPSTPSGKLSMLISTATDTTAVKSAPYSVLSATKISQPLVDNSSPSATAGARTAYVVTFTTSRTGGLSNAAGSGITLVFPSGTGLGSVSTSSVDDTTTGANGIGACNPPSGETITCFLDEGKSVAPLDSVRVRINGVTNPSTPSGSLIMSISTTSDTIPVKSVPYTVALPPPVPGKSVDAAPVSGVVLVKRPGKKTFIRLQAGQQIPLGSEVNATGGVVTLVVATNRHGHKATGRASGGVFRVTQGLAAGTEITFLTLAGPKPTGCSARTARAARPRRHHAVTFRDPGPFVTIGSYARGRGKAATGTTWLTENTCAGTLIRVARGAVFFHDIPHHRTFLLRAGQSFLAHPGKGG
jgi:hypothetical protein